MEVPGVIPGGLTPGFETNINFLRERYALMRATLLCPAPHIEDFDLESGGRSRSIPSGLGNVSQSRKSNRSVVLRNKKKKTQAAQSYEQLEQDFEAKLDAMSFEEQCALGRSISPFLVKRLKEIGNPKSRSVRGPLLGKLLCKSQDQPEAVEGAVCEWNPKKRSRTDNRGLSV